VGNIRSGSTHIKAWVQRQQELIYKMSFTEKFFHLLMNLINVVNGQRTLGILILVLINSYTIYKKMYLNSQKKHAKIIDS